MKDFRKKINEFEYSYEPGAWEEMEQMLDKAAPTAHVSNGSLFLKIIAPIILGGVAFAIFFNNSLQPTNSSIAVNSGQLIEIKNSENIISEYNKNTISENIKKEKTNNTKSIPTTFQNSSNPNISINKKTETINGNTSNKSIKPISQKTNKQFKAANNSVVKNNNSSDIIIKPNLQKTDKQYKTVKEAAVFPIVSLNKISTKNILKPIKANNNSAALLANIPKLKAPEMRLPILLNITNAAAFREDDTGFRLKIDAIYPINKKWGAGLSFAQSWYTPIHFMTPFEETKTNKNASELYAMSRYSIFENNKHKTSFKAGIGYQNNYLRVSRRINTTEGINTTQLVVNDDHFGADIGIDYQYFFHPHFSVGANFGYSYGSPSAFYVGAMVGYRFKSFKIKDLKTNVNLY